MHREARRILRKALKSGRNVFTPDLLKLEKSIFDSELKKFLIENQYIQIIADQGLFRITQLGIDFCKRNNEKRYFMEKYFQPITINIVVALVTGFITYQFTSYRANNDVLQGYRKENISQFKPEIQKVVSLIKDIDRLYLSFSSKKFSLNEKGIVNSINGEAADQALMLGRLINQLGEISFELPYQFRIVGLSAKNHYGIKFGKVLSPAMYADSNLKTEVFSGMTFVRNIWRAEQDYILYGEPVFDIDYNIYK